MRPALLVIGHGTKSAPGCEQFAQLVERVQLRVPHADVAGGFLELAPPPIQDAVNRLVDAGHTSIDVVPLVLVAAGHSKGDITAALKREELRHPGLVVRRSLAHPRRQRASELPNDGWRRKDRRVQLGEDVEPPDVVERDERSRVSDQQRAHGCVSTPRRSAPTDSISACMVTGSSSAGTAGMPRAASASTNAR